MGCYMTATKFLSTAKLLEYTDSYINELLNAHGVFPLVNYSFIGHDEPGPDYAGIGSWYRLPLTHIGDPTFNPDNLTATQKKLAIAGAEFEGMLNSARMCIGYQLLYLDNACNPVFENIDVSWLKPPLVGDTTLFYLHLNNSLITLNVASDRVREVLLALFGMKGIKYTDKKPNGNKAAYWQPFEFAKSKFQMSGVESSELKAQLDKVVQLSHEVQKFRKYRNDIIHKIGSKNAHTAERWLNTPYITEKEKIATYEYNEEFFTECEQKKKNGIILESKKTIDWYYKLVDLANCVFWIESLVRNDAEE